MTAYGGHSQRGQHWIDCPYCGCRGAGDMAGQQVQGTQVVGRVAQLLRIVARSADAGASLPEIVKASGLTRPTVHRLLSALAAEGLLDQGAESGTWHLGPELYVMGAVAAGRYAIEDLA